MDIKAFLIGAASGALVFAAVSSVLGPDQENGLPEVPHSGARSTIASNVEMPVAKEDRTADSSLPMQSTDRITTDKQSESRQVPVNEIHNQPFGGHGVSDEDIQRIADRRAGAGS